MRVAMVHPRREAALIAFHEQRCRVWRLGRSGTEELLADVPAAYLSARGRPPGAWGEEGPALDQIRLGRWYPEISSPARASLTLLDGTLLEFEVQDVLPCGPGPDATLLLVSPRR